MKRTKLAAFLFAILCWIPYAFAQQSPSESHLLGKKCIYTHAYECFPPVNLHEEDFSAGLSLALKESKSFFSSALQEQFAQRFQNDLPKGCCEGTSLFLAGINPIHSELSPEQKQQIVYFQAMVSLREFMKDLLRKNDLQAVFEHPENFEGQETRLEHVFETLETCHTFHNHIVEAAVCPHLLTQKKALATELVSEEKKFIQRKGRPDKEFTEEVLQWILTSVVKNPPLTNVLLNTSSQNDMGHCILVQLKPPLIFDPAYGGYRYHSFEELLVDLLKQTNSLLKTEMVWIDEIVSVEPLLQKKNKH